MSPPLDAFGPEPTPDIGLEPTPDIGEQKPPEITKPPEPPPPPAIEPPKAEAPRPFNPNEPFEPVHPAKTPAPSEGARPFNPNEPMEAIGWTKHNPYVPKNPDEFEEFLNTAPEGSYIKTPKGLTQIKPRAEVEEKPSEDINYNDPRLGPVETGPSATSAFGHHAALGVVPAIAGGVAGTVGAVAGGAAGTFVAPGPGTVVGGIAGGVAAGTAAAIATQKAQDYLLGFVPKNVKEYLGISEEQLAEQEQAHPYASMAGGIASNLAAFNIGSAARSAVVAERTLAQAAANQVMQRSLPAAISAAQEYVMELKEGEPVNYTKVGMALAGGAMYGRGREYIEAGVRPTKAILDKLAPGTLRAYEAELERIHGPPTTPKPGEAGTKTAEGTTGAGTEGEPPPPPPPPKPPGSDILEPTTPEGTAPTGETTAATPPPPPPPTGAEGEPTAPVGATEGEPSREGVDLTKIAEEEKTGAADEEQTEEEEEQGEAALKEQAKPPEEQQQAEAAAAPKMTRQERTQLRKLGYTNDAIKELTPLQARGILADATKAPEGEAPPVVPPTGEEVAAAPTAGGEAPPVEPTEQATAEGGAWRAVQPDEIFQPGRRFRMNQTTGQSEVFEPGQTTEQATAETAAEPTAEGTEAPKTAGFTTAKGSTYEVHEDGTTTRNKSYHPEHGPEDVGLQPRSEATLYVDPNDARLLAPPSSESAASRIVVQPDGKLRLATKPVRGRWGWGGPAVEAATEPQVGMTPVELWGREANERQGDGYSNVHFGNNITEVREGGATTPEVKGAAAYPAADEATLAQGRDAISAAFSQTGPKGALDAYNDLAGRFNPDSLKPLSDHVDQLLGRSAEPEEGVGAAEEPAAQAQANAPAVSEEAHPKTGDTVYRVRFPDGSRDGGDPTVPKMATSGKKDARGQWETYPGEDGQTQPGWVFRSREAADAFVAKAGEKLGTSAEPTATVAPATGVPDATAAQIDPTTARIHASMTPEQLQEVIDRTNGSTDPNLIKIHASATAELGKRTGDSSTVTIDPTGNVAEQGGAPAAPAAPAVPTVSPEDRLAQVRSTGIAADVANQVIKAGRPEEEALAFGQQVEARYETLAQQFPQDGDAATQYANKFPPIKGPDDYGASGARELGQQQGQTTTFVSPNEKNLTFEQAQSGMRTNVQNLLRQFSAHIDRLFGIQSSHQDAVGAWADGAENTVVTNAPSVDPVLERAAAAMKGYLANQKAVLSFRRDPAGPDSMISFPAKGSLADIHQGLLAEGATFHTLQPTADGAIVHIYAGDQDTVAVAQRAAQRFGADALATYDQGHGDFIGTNLPDHTPDAEARADARRVYQEAIDHAAPLAQHDLRAAWDDLNNRWDTAKAEAERLDASARELGQPKRGPLPPEVELPKPGRSKERNLTALDILDPNQPKEVKGRFDVGTIAQKLLDRGRAALRALGIYEPLTEKNRTRETDRLLARTLASEVREAMQRDGHAGNWYTGNVQEAMRIAEQIHPELRNDPGMRRAYIASLAITSQGENVTNNTAYADRVFKYYKEHGEFPTHFKYQHDEPINGNFQKLNDLLKDPRIGPDKLWDFLEREMTARELRDLTGIKVQGANLGDRVYGSAILGPKIGQGFYQNLIGNYTPVTMDMWWMRTWGRLTGTLIGGVSKEGMAEQYNRFRESLWKAGIPVPNSDEAMVDLANRIRLKHESDYRKFRQEFEDGTRTKSDLVLNAISYQNGLVGINQQPGSPANRQWMRDIANNARAILARQGIHITNADLQALIWYPEKAIYSKLGSRGDTETLNVDYSKALRDLAASKGIQLADRSEGQPVRPVVDRPGPAGPADDTGAAEANGGRGGGLHGGQEAPPTAADAARSLNQELDDNALRGKYRFFPDGTSVIHLFDKADASTIFHEAAHHWLEEMMTHAARSDAPMQLRADAHTIRQWLGAKPGEAITDAQHEQWAQGFEQFNREGKAPTPLLRRAFEQIRDWFMKIYDHADELGVPINDDMRQVYDRMLSHESGKPEVPANRSGYRYYKGPINVGGEDRVMFRASKRDYAAVGFDRYGYPSFSGKMKPGFQPVEEITKQEFDRLNDIKSQRLNAERTAGNGRFYTNPGDSWVPAEHAAGVAAEQPRTPEQHTLTNAVMGDNDGARELGQAARSPPATPEDNVAQKVLNNIADRIPPRAGGIRGVVDGLEAMAAPTGTSRRWVPNPIMQYVSTMLGAASKDSDVANLMAAHLDMHRVAETNKQRYQQMLEPFNGATPQQWENVFNLAEVANLMGKDLKGGPYTITNDGSNSALHQVNHTPVGMTRTLTDPREIKMFDALRDTMDRGLWEYGKSAVKEFDIPAGTAMRYKAIEAIAAAETDPVKKLNYERAAMILEQIENRGRAGYLPMRRSGNYSYRVKPKAAADGIDPRNTWDGEGDAPTLYFGMIDALSQGERWIGGMVREVPRLAQEELARLQASFPEDRWDIIHDWLARDESGLRATLGDQSIPLLDRLMTLSGSDVKSQLARGMIDRGMAVDDANRAALAQYNAMWDVFKAEVNEQKTAGFRRQRANVAGYNPDMAQATMQYLGQIAHASASLEYGSRIEAANAVIRDRPDDGVKTMVAEWNRRREMSNWDDPLNGALEKARQGAFHMLLAGNPATFFKILLHGPLRAMPILGTGLGANGRMMAAGQWMKTFGEVSQYMRGNMEQGLHVDLDGFISRLKPDEAAAVRAAWNDGTLHSHNYDELAAVKDKGAELALGPRANFARRVLNIWGSTVGLADTMVRTSQFLATYRIAKQFWEPMNTTWSRDALWAATPNKSPEAMARFLTDKTVGISGRLNSIPLFQGQLGRLFGQFKTYEVGYVSNLVSQLKNMGPEGKVTAVMMLGSMGLMGGLTAVPFFGDIENAADFVGKMIDKEWPGIDIALRDAMDELVPGQSEMILHGGRPFGIDFSSIGLGDVLSRNGRSAWDLFGAAPSVFLGGAGRGYERYRSGQSWQEAAQEVMPNVLKHPLQAMYPELVRTNVSGTSQYVPTEADRLKIGLGFTPEDKALQTEQRGAYLHTAAEYRKYVTDGSNTIANLWQRGNVEEAMTKYRDTANKIAEGEKRGVLNQRALGELRSRLKSAMMQRQEREPGTAPPGTKQEQKYYQTNPQRRLLPQSGASP